MQIPANIDRFERTLVKCISILHGLHLCEHFVSKGHLFVLGYHRIRPGNRFRCSFDEGVYGPDAEQFTRQMQWIKKNTTVLSEDELIRLLSGDIEPHGPYSMVTFDDGYADNYDIAFPIFRDLGIPAIFFIASQSVEDRTVGWWDTIAYLIKQTDKKEISLRGRRFFLEGRRGATIRELQQYMKLEPARATETLLEDLARACETDLPSFSEQDRELMTWDQIRDVVRNGISVGSHSHSHRVLATLDREVQRQEMLTSKSILEEKTGYCVRSIAFPVGGTSHFSEDTPVLAAECGYSLAFSFNTGHNVLGNVDAYRIQRMAAPDELRMLSATCAFPRLMMSSSRSEVGTL